MFILCQRKKKYIHTYVIIYLFSLMYKLSHLRGETEIFSKLLIVLKNVLNILILLGLLFIIS